LTLIEEIGFVVKLTVILTYTTDTVAYQQHTQWPMRGTSTKPKLLHRHSHMWKCSH